MKINWGSGIAIFYTLFVVTMLAMVYMSTQNKSHLVQENYYNKDLNYEAFRLKKQNASQMAEPLEMNYSVQNRALEFSFPESMITSKGKVALFRPSDKYQDKEFEISLSPDGRMTIPVDHKWPRGLWYVQVDWIHEGIEYYKEESISL